MHPHRLDNIGGRRGPSSLVCGASLLALTAVALAPARADAAEVRRGDRIDVAADEVVDDSLIALGERVVIRGHVRGDAVAFAQSVTVDGVIDGNLITAANRIEIDGDVKGSVMTAGQNVKIGGLLGSQLYAAGQDLALDHAMQLQGDAMLAGANIDVAGALGRDVYASGSRVAVDGSLTRDLVMSGADLRLGSAATVGRNLTAKVADDEDLSIQGLVYGVTDVEISQPEPSSRYASFGYYAWKLMMLAAGLIVGLVALLLAPGLFRAPQDEKQWLRIAGIGFLALVAVPFASIVVAATVIGLPLAAVATGGYVLALYVGKLVVAAEFGRRILRLRGQSRGELVWSLLLGLTLVTVLVALPWVGAVFGFVIAVLGLGTVSNHLLARWRQRRTPKTPAPASREHGMPDAEPAPAE